MKRITLGKSVIGEGRAFLVAEVGINHNGNLSLAKEAVTKARESGADAVKFQIFKTELFYSPDHEGFSQTGGDVFKLMKSLELREEEWKELKAHADSEGILFFASPLDPWAFALLEEMDVELYKVASLDLTNLPFLKAMGAVKKPMIISTGMAALSEVARAVETVRGVGNRKIILLQCLSLYPAPAGGINLRAMETLRGSFGCPVGLSDHTDGTSVALGAAALGAAVIEKHFTCGRDLPGPDHPFSLEPKEFSQLVKGVREVEVALGDGLKGGAVGREKSVVNPARRALYALRDLLPGERLKPEDIVFKRPQRDGIPPELYDFVLGLTLKRGVPAGSPIRKRDLL